MTGRIKALLILIPVLCLAAAPARAERSKVTVAERPEYEETELRVESGDCSIGWILHHTELNKRVVQQRTACRRPLAVQAELVGLLLAEASKRPGFGEVNTLFLGRLYTPDRGSMEMSRRLALAAHRSPDWDPVRGRPKTGLAEMNKLTARLAQRAGIHRELARVFDRAGLRLEVISVEKVMSVEAGQTPFYNWLAQRGVRPGEKLPIDCLTWLWFSRK